MKARRRGVILGPDSKLALIRYQQQSHLPLRCLLAVADKAACEAIGFLSVAVLVAVLVAGETRGTSAENGKRS